MTKQTQDNSLQALITDLEENAKRLEGFNATGPAYRQRKYASALKAMDKNTAQHFSETLMHHELELQALAQPAQEPEDVARVQEDGSVEWNPNLPDLPVGTKLYTHPAPAQEWVGLSDDEITSLVRLSEERRIQLFDLIQQALKAKNYGR